MKKIYSITLIAACAMMVFSCKNNDKEEKKLPNPIKRSIEVVDRSSEALFDDAITYASVEIKPTFDGGDANDFVKYVQKNLKYPASALENHEEGRVTVNFIVDQNGKVQNAKVVKGVSEALDAEALRVVSNSPDWTPGQQGGDLVPVSFSIPVLFKIH